MMFAEFALIISMILILLDLLLLLEIVFRLIKASCVVRRHVCDCSLARATVAPRVSLCVFVSAAASFHVMLG